MRRQILGFGRTISGIGVTIAALCLIIDVIINGANVVARYVFYQPFSWAEDAMVYIMIAGVFWGGAAAAWRQIDIHIDAFVNLAAPRLRATLRLLANLIAIAVLGTLFEVGLRAIIQLYGYGQRNDALGMPVWIAHAAFASGLLLILLMSIARLFAPQDDADTPAQGKDGEGIA